MVVQGRADAGSSIVVLHVVLSLDPGGTERLVVDMSNRLAEQGVQVHICCLDAVGSLAAGLDENVTVHLVPRDTRFSPNVAWRLAALARRQGITVLHCHQYTPFVYGCATRLFMPSLGMVFTEHGRLFGAVPSRRRRVANRLLTHIAGHQFAVSDELRRFMLHEGFSPNRLGVIHNGIEPGRRDASARREARRSLGLADDDFVVGTSARFDQVKDLPTLVEAAAALQRSEPKLKLALFGDGPSRSDVEEVARQCRLQGLILPGHLSHARSLLPALDVYVNCSLSEGISVAILEAMDAGVAIVATAVGGTPEIVRADQDGILVAPRSVPELTSALALLASRPERRRELALSAQQRVDASFTADRMVRCYVDAYGGVNTSDDSRSR